jgi:hypothetical protein
MSTAITQYVIQHRLQELPYMSKGFASKMDSEIDCSPILVAIMMEAIYSSETFVLTRVIRRRIPEDGIRYIVDDQFPNQQYVLQTNSVALSPRANYTD